MNIPSITRLAAIALVTSVSLSGLRAEDTVYTAVVEKILNSSCTGCHKADKKKGKLDMSSYEELMKGGKGQAKGKKTVEPGKAADSYLIKLVELPKEDDDHMPPSDSKAPQLTDKEVAVLKWWVNEGAKNDTKLADAKVPDDLKATVEELSKKKVEAPGPEPKKPE